MSVSHFFAHSKRVMLSWEVAALYCSVGEKSTGVDRLLFVSEDGGDPVRGDKVVKIVPLLVRVKGIHNSCAIRYLTVFKTRAEIRGENTGQCPAIAALSQGCLCLLKGVGLLRICICRLY